MFNDNVCLVDYKPGYKLRNWLSAVRAEIVRITAPTVIMYLESTMEIQDVPPLKNTLQMLCKAIQQHQGVHIFICNLLPHIMGSPVRKPAIQQVNFNLLQATRSTSRAMGGKIHYLSVYEHFTSKKRGKIISPTSKYFHDDSQLTYYGCLMFRECLLREVGIKSYWF